jgi:hypothetical protein
MGTFSTEVSFLSQILVGEKFEEQVVKKTATFKEWSRTDKDQHKLHFMLVSIFKTNGNKMVVDSDQLYDITVKAVEVMLVPDASFNEQDRTEFLNDGGGLIQFGMWYMANKIAPFFSELMKK